MGKNEQILKTYKRNHKGSNFEDEEKRKIFKEKFQVEKLGNEAKSILNRFLVTSDDGLLDEYNSIFHQSKKVAGNLNTHKIRLKELQKNDDFE